MATYGIGIAAAATSSTPVTVEPTTTVRPRSVIRENQAGPFTTAPAEESGLEPHDFSRLGFLVSHTRSARVFDKTADLIHERRGLVGVDRSQPGPGRRTRPEFTSSSVWKVTFARGDQVTFPSPTT